MGIKDFFRKTEKKVIESKTFQDFASVVMDDPSYKDKAQILSKIESYDTIIIHRHRRPDGDAIGSSLGLRSLLRTNYPEKKIYAVGGDIPPYLQFLGKEDEIADDVYQNALIIVVDTANRERIADDRYANGKEIIKIDHHISDENFGSINYVQEEVGATCLILIDFYKTFSSQLTLSKDAALCFYLGTVTDTGRFKWIDAEGLRLASLMLEKGIDTEQMFTFLQVKRPESFKIMGYVYNHFQITSSGVAYIYITKKIRKKYKATLEECANMVGSLDSIEGSLIWILFLEYDTEIRVRIRSRYITIDDIGSHYHGGGHAKAAGATVYSKKEMKQLLSEADQKLQTFKMEHKELF